MMMILLLFRLVLHRILIVPHLARQSNMLQDQQ